MGYTWGCEPTITTQDMESQLLTLAALLLGVGHALAADTKSDDPGAMLRAFTISCKDCSTLQYGDATPIEVPCPAGTLCGPVNGAYNCIAEDSPDVASCSCGGKESTYMAEPYDPSKYIACLPGGGQSVLECEAGEIFTGATDKPCDKGPSCEAAQQGFNPLLPDCRKYFFCKEGGAGGEEEASTERKQRSSFLREDEADAETPEPVPTFECPEGQIFNIATLTCMDPCSLAPEAFKCEAGASGAFADPSDCQIFNLCVGGNTIGGPISCPPDKYFNGESQACDADDDTNCPKDSNE